MTAIAPSGLNNPAETPRSDLAVAGLAALGIVFGDIGTSPLYTLKTAFDFLGGEPTPERILGILSLLIWTLFLITSIKYVTVAMSIDNRRGRHTGADGAAWEKDKAAPGTRGRGSSRGGAHLRRRRYHACNFRTLRA